MIFCSGSNWCHTPTHVVSELKRFCWQSWSHRPQPSAWRLSARYLKWHQRRVSIIHGWFPHSLWTKKNNSFCARSQRLPLPLDRRSAGILLRLSWNSKMFLIYWVYFLLAFTTCYFVALVCRLCHSAAKHCEERLSCIAHSIVSLCNHLAHENCRGGE